MSQELTNARRQLSQINSLLRQSKILPAVQSLHSALLIVLRQSLMRSEKEEFEKLFEDAAARLNADRSLRKIYPIELQYTPGNEKALLADLVELLSMLQDESLAEAEAIAKAIEGKKTAALEEGQKYLDAKQFDKARAIFNTLIQNYPDDSDLHAVIGEKLIKAGLFEDAAEELILAVKHNPYSLQHYNLLGIALRKLGRFELAESYYAMALPLAPEDPNLHFNIGRLYLEWGKWNKAVEYADKAYELNPAFEEAKKLGAFARKKAGA